MRVVNDEPVPQSGDENVVVCEPAVDVSATEGSSDPATDPDRWVLEEDGYGYGV